MTSVRPEADHLPDRYHRPLGTRRRTTAVLLALASFAVGCTGAYLPRAVPEDLENPITFHVRGGTPPEVIDVAMEVLSYLSIPVQAVDRTDARIETRWVDVADHVQTVRDAYPVEERLVRYHITVHETGRLRERAVEIFSGYRPLSAHTARGGDRPVPRRHPGTQIALRIHDRLRTALIEANMEVSR